MRNFLFAIIISFLILGLTYGATLNITQGSTAIVISSGASSGTAPYTYQWFNQCPSCSSFSTIAGATNTVYFFNTNTLTSTGNWQFLLQATDSASTIANSVGTNVIVGNAISSSGSGINVSIGQSLYSLLPDLFFAFAMIIFILRLALYDEQGYRWAVMDFFSALMMFMAFYYYVFSPISTTTLNSSTTNTISGLQTTNGTISIHQAATPVASWGFYLFVVITLFYIMIMGIFAIKDFLEAKSTGNNHW